MRGVFQGVFGGFILCGTVISFVSVVGAWSGAVSLVIRTLIVTKHMARRNMKTGNGKVERIEN